MKPVCLHCGEPERCQVVEAWGDGTFMLDTCCEGMRDAAAEYMVEDPRGSAAWLASLEDDDGDKLEELCGHQLRRVADDDGHLLLDWKLEVRPIPQAEAKAFIREHHRHCRPPAGWRFGAGIWNGGTLVGVASVGRPVARGYDRHTVVEVNRLCVRTDVPRELVWNACSQLYGWAARKAKAKGFHRVITYLHDDEPGTSVKAAGFTLEATLPPRRRGWRNGVPICGKTRWVRELRT